MPVNESRYRTRKAASIGSGPIVYWMNRESRARDNWALLLALELSQQHGRPLIVVYNLLDSFLGGGQRQFWFKATALQEVSETLTEMDIPFYLLRDTAGESSAGQLTEFFDEHNAAVIVTDFSPLRMPQQWLDDVCEAVEVPVIEVDAHNIVPAWVTSDKREFAAHTIRRKIWSQLPEYLEDFPRLRRPAEKYNGKVPAIDWADIIPERPAGLEWITPGERAAKRVFKKFLIDRLPHYAADRNDPEAEAQSDMSPYLHYGMISAQAMAYDIVDMLDVPVVELLSSTRNKAKVDPKTDLTLADHAGAYLEELIVRKELSDNFCLYEPNYDRVAGFPEWARDSIAEHAADKREYVYTIEQFEAAETHDELWNAAQTQMMQTGKMHGYMRMYWAKKILEWTPDAATALSIAIDLNDRYQLDGRDPNGYAGIAWSIGGLHDRPWFERPVYGKIRYMARSGCERKFDVPAYLERFGQGTPKLF